VGVLKRSKVPYGFFFALTITFFKHVIVDKIALECPKNEKLSEIKQKFSKCLKKLCYLKLKLCSKTLDVFAYQLKNPIFGLIYRF